MAFLQATNGSCTGLFLKTETAAYALSSTWRKAVRDIHIKKKNLLVILLIKVSFSSITRLHTTTWRNLKIIIVSSDQIIA